jgi:outer membrane protein assembly factor BamB
VTSPALSPDGSTVYIGSTDSNVYAFDSNTGVLKWNFNTGGLNSPSWPNVLGGSSPIVTPDGNFVFIQSQHFCYDGDDGDDYNACSGRKAGLVLTALDAKDGSVVWDVEETAVVPFQDTQFSMLDPSIISPVLGPPGSGTIYVSGSYS